MNPSILLETQLFVTDFILCFGNNKKRKERRKGEREGRKEGKGERKERRKRGGEETKGRKERREKTKGKEILAFNNPFKLSIYTNISW